MIKPIPTRYLIGPSFVGLVLATATWSTVNVFLPESLRRERTGALDVDKDVDYDIANPMLTPSDVVKLQVDSMRDAVQDAAKLKVCYSLASPDNRKATGPFSRFVELVSLPPYDRLATCVDWQMGRTVSGKELAYVLVTAISPQGEISAFRFVLHRQTDRPADCWMTDAVQFLTDDAIHFPTSPSKSAEPNN